MGGHVPEALKRQDHDIILCIVVPLCYGILRYRLAPPRHFRLEGLKTTTTQENRTRNSRGSPFDAGPSGFLRSLVLVSFCASVWDLFVTIDSSWEFVPGKALLIIPNRLKSHRCPLAPSPIGRPYKKQTILKLCEGNVVKPWSSLFQAGEHSESIDFCDIPLRSFG